MRLVASTQSSLALLCTIVGFRAFQWSDGFADSEKVDVITEPRYEDFDIAYHYKNPWAHPGIGYSMKNRKKKFSPYRSQDQIDSKRLDAVGGPPVNEASKIEEQGPGAK